MYTDTWGGVVHEWRKVMPIDQMTQFEVEDLCQEFKSQGYPIEVEIQTGKVFLDAKQDAFIPNCQTVLLQVVDIQEKRHGNNKLLLSKDVGMLVNFDATHKDVKLRFVLRAGTPVMFFMQGTTVFVNLAEQRPDDFDRSLKHEYGHVRDNTYLASQEPILKDFATTGFATPEVSQKLMQSYLNLARSNLDPQEQKRFDDLKLGILGDLTKYDIGLLNILIFHFAEAFRYGEEITTKDFRGYFLSDEFKHMKRGQNIPENAYAKGQMSSVTGQNLDLKRTLVLARIQEMGIQNEFPLNQEEAKKIPVDHVEFFCLFLRGVSRLQLKLNAIK